MICHNCSSLSFMYTKKKCVRCTGETITNLSILCEACSLKDKICAVCLKKIVPQNKRVVTGKCNCGGK